MTKKDFWDKVVQIFYGLDALHHTQLCHSTQRNNVILGVQSMHYVVPACVLSLCVTIACVLHSNDSAQSYTTQHNSPKYCTVHKYLTIRLNLFVTIKKHVTQ